MLSALKAAYNRCDVEKPLEPGDTRYVPFDDLGVRGSDRSCIDFLMTRIEMSDGATHQLFSGFRGCGKSTELRRLAKNLAARRFNVVVIDTEDFINLRVPASTADLLITLAAGMDQHLRGGGSSQVHPPSESFWQRFKNLLGTEVTVDGMTIKLPEVAEFELSFKGDVDFKTKLYRALEGRQPELARECRRFVEEGMAELKRRHPKSEGTVLIVDSFEKLRGDALNGEAVRRSVEDVFIRDWRYLKAPCHVIYTVPPWMAFLEAGTAAEFERVHLMPMCKVWDPKAEKDHEAGLDAMMELLSRRIEVKRLFREQDSIRELARASGGYPREFLRMVRELFVRMRLENVTLPISREVACSLSNRAINVFIEQYHAPITEEDIPLLVQVARHRAIAKHSRDDLDRLASLFDHHFVLSYRNGDAWFDLHPLVRRTKKMKEALSVPSTDDDHGSAE